MPSILEKEWAAVDEEENILVRADTEAALRTKMENEGLVPEEYEIIALPKTHNSLYI